MGGGYVSLCCGLNLDSWLMPFKLQSIQTWATWWRKAFFHSWFIVSCLLVVWSSTSICWDLPSPSFMYQALTMPCLSFSCSLKVLFEAIGSLTQLFGRCGSWAEKHASELNLNEWLGIYIECRQKTHKRREKKVAAPYKTFLLKGLTQIRSRNHSANHQTASN